MKTTMKKKPNPNKANAILAKINSSNEKKRPSVEMDNGFTVNHTAGAKWKSL